ncbi:smoothelin-like isoform X2 [Eucyclogobius newberryi]
MDLDERRLIRSAIRELRRREIQDMEAALATKRFRPTRVPPLEDKENHEENHRENLHQHKPESSDALELLSQKLQGIRDIEELTKMLRSAGEYEERKMIRATIRQIREEHQQSAVERCRALERLDGPSGVRTQVRASQSPSCPIGRLWWSWFGHQVTSPHSRRRAGC